MSMGNLLWWAPLLFGMATNSHRPSDAPRHAGEPGMVGIDHPTVVPDNDEADEE
jgi:hypothetical protein